VLLFIQSSVNDFAEVDDDVPLIGSHGLELRLAAGERPATLAPDEAARHAGRLALGSALVDDVPGAWIEDKPAGFAVHVRLVEGERASRLEGDVRALLDREQGLTVRAGKNVVELALRDATKGDGLRALRSRFAADAVAGVQFGAGEHHALVVLEPGDVGIKVGAAPTVAAHRVADPAALTVALSLLTSARESPGSAG